MSASSLALTLVVALAGFGACGPASQAPSSSTVPGVDVTSEQQSHTRLLSMPTSGYAESAELVLRDAAAFAAAWRTLHQGIPGNPPPAIDFARRMVVLLALGQRNTGGHGIRFDAIVASGAGATVRYTVTSPGAGCMTTQAITSPVDVVSVPRVDGEIRFERRSVVQEC